jgi:hypothetical protein
MFLTLIRFGEDLMKKRSFIISSLVLSVILIWGVPALADWNPGDPYKWLQMPNVTSNGVDVSVGAVGLADDFLCTSSGSITDIHIWGSFRHSYFQPYFYLKIYSDIPANTGGIPYSRPGDILWSWGGYATSSRSWPAEQQYFYVPTMGDIGLDNAVYQFNFIIPQDQAFSQTSATTYWLAMGIYGGFYNEFGWKTSTQHWNDDAVTWNTVNNRWYDLHYFPGHPYPAFRTGKHVLRRNRSIYQ